MEEKIFVGYNFGNFQTPEGETKDYCNVFFLEDFSGSESDRYHFDGQKASKRKCVSPKLFEGINIGDRVFVAFDSKERVSYMIAAE